MIKKSVKKKASKKKVVEKKIKTNDLTKKEARVISKLILFVPAFILSALLTWLISTSTLETIFIGLAILTGIISATLILILAGILLAKNKN